MARVPQPGAKPKTNIAPAKVPGRTPFVLGSRPDSLRQPSPAPVQRIKPVNSQREYGKGGNEGNIVPPYGASS